MYRAVAHDGPTDSSERIGQCDHDDVTVRASRTQFIDLLTQTMGFGVHVEVAAASPMDEQLA